MSTLWTIGHSTHDADVFVAMLLSHSIEVLADVRRFPASRKYPHFNTSELQKVLSQSSIAYQHFENLGGRRTPRKDSHNTAWRNESFRGYADYMETPQFENAAQSLMQIASENPTAIMCAEAVWWRCHRGLIADYFKVRGWKVLHVMSRDKTEPHPYTSAARIVDGKLSYAAAPGEQLSLLTDS
jgi:uncharacterized protein (DUF488 family)